VCQNPLVPALDAGPQKSKPYQSDVYMTGFNAIPRQAREQDSFDTSLQRQTKKIRVHRYLFQKHKEVITKMAVSPTAYSHF